MAELKTKTKYVEAVGRRKTSIARVRLEEASSQSVIINGKDLVDYFPTKAEQKAVWDAFNEANIPVKFKVSVKVLGGGFASQAVAIRHSISRALEKHDRSLRKVLKVKGFLKRDPRAKERRKFGLKKARKAPKWSKR